jgi:glycosyltransferase involved in cell wall biosynthesis
VRVLVLARTKITELDNLGVSIGGWFRGWSPERIAQVYSGGSTQAPCLLTPRIYRLTGRERRWGWLFSRLKATSFAESTVVSGRAMRESQQRPSPWRRARYALGQRFLSSGLWELLFQPRLSPELLAWVKDFAPEVIYAHTSDLYFMDLCLEVSKAARVPFCLHVMDDYPDTLYKHSPFSMVLRPRVDRRFRALVAGAGVRLAISPAMATEYSRRYRVPFHPVLNCDDPERFERAQAERLGPPGQVNIVYCGSLYLRRWRPIVDVARAAAALAERGRKVAVHVHTSRLEPAAAAAFQQHPNIRVHDMPTHENGPALFKGADILLLPESFEPAIAEYIRFSLSSKVQLYLLSRRPVLVYAPPGSGTAEYARAWGWGEIVDRPGDVDGLAASIERLLSEPARVAALLERGRRCAVENHDGAQVRQRFRRLLQECAQSQGH